MPKKKQPSTNLEDYYTLEEAVKRLSENAGRPIDENYPRTLVRYGKIESIDVGRTKLYLKRDIDAYVVSTKRGRKTPQRKEGEEERPLAIAI